MLAATSNNTHTHTPNNQPTGGVSLLESRAGRFLCAEPDGTVVADRAVLSTWEVFELEVFELAAEGSRGEAAAATAREVFAFRSFHGQYLRIVDGDGPGPPDAATISSTRVGAGSLSSSPPPLLALTTAEEPTFWELSMPVR